MIQTRNKINTIFMEGILTGLQVTLKVDSEIWNGLTRFDRHRTAQFAPFHRGDVHTALERMFK